MSNSDLKSSPSHAQAENAEQSAKTQSASSLKPIARGARILFLGLACIGIPIFAALIGYAVWLSGRSNGIIEGASTSPLRVVSPINEHTSSADQQKEIEAAAHEAMEQDESLLDKLLLLVGLYSTILSFLALATVIVSRQDAKEQLQKVREDTKSLAEESEKKIEKIRSAAETDLQELKTQIRAEFPIISQLQKNVLNLILELEAKYPEEQDSARKQPSTWKSEVRQQDTLIDELQIVAVSVVVLDDANLLKLYLALSRSYLVRFQTGAQTDNDAARALLYADRALHCSPHSAEAYRMRGAAALVRYRTAEKSRKASDEFVDLLRNAKKDLKQCITIDPTELGAYCNLALTWDELGDRREAIRLSEEALAKLPSYPRIGLEKFLPDVSVNFACYLADDYRQTSDRDNQTELRFRIAKVCTDCRDYLRDTLKSSTAKVRFKTAMQRELAEGGDFRELPPETRTALEELIVAEKPSQDKLGHG